MSQAIFGLIGVIVGSGLTYLGRVMLQVRSERRDARAALLVAREDLREALGRVSRAIEKDRWPTSARKTWLDVWAQQRPQLATYMARDGDFRTLVEAYGRMDELESGLNSQRSELRASSSTTGAATSPGSPRISPARTWTGSSSTT